LLSSRDVSFSYSSCDESYSALCKTTENICHSHVTVPLETNTTKVVTTSNATQSISVSNSTIVTRFNPRISMTSEDRTNFESTTIEKRNQDSSFSISSNSPSAGGKTNFLHFNVETRYL